MKKLHTLILGLFIASMAFAQVDRSKMPTPGPAPKIQLDEPNEFELKNGLKVLVVENNKLPRVRVSLNLDNSPRTYGDKIGVETMVSALMGKGTQSMDKDAFNERVDFLGATISYGSESGFAASLSKYFEEVLGMFADGAINPKFTQEEFDKEKARVIDGLKADEKSQDAAADRVRRLVDYGKGHPFSEFVTEESVNNISLADVQNFHTTYFRPNNGYLVIVGDVDTKQVKKLVTKAFSKWKKGSIPAEKMNPVPSISKTHIQLVDMPSSTQSILNISYPVEMDKNNPDFFPVLVASKILGGNFNSRLNMNLREANGWTYGARGGISDNRYIGRFYASAKVRNEVTDSAIVEAIKEIKKMTMEPVTQEEIDITKAKFTGDFVLSLERPATVADFAVDVKTEKLDDDFYKNYLKNIDNVTIDDVLRVSKKYFDVDKANIHVVGKGAEIYPALKKLGYPINHFDKWGEKGEVPTAKAKLAALPTISSPVTNIKSAKQIIENYIKSVGGSREKLAQFKTVEMNGSVSAPVFPAPGTVSWYYTQPNKWALILNVGGMKVGQGSNGTKAWEMQGGPKKEIPMDGIVKAQKNFVQQLDYKESQLTYEGVENVNGKDLFKITVNFGEEKITEHYDPATSYLMQFTAPSPNGDVVFTLDKYTNAGGIMVPTEMKMTPTGMPFSIDMVFSEFKLNENIDNAVFE